MRLADGLSGEATRLIDEGKPAEAIPVYRRALVVRGVPNPIGGDMELSNVINEQRNDLEGMLKELKVVSKKKKPNASVPQNTLLDHRGYMITQCTG